MLLLSQEEIQEAAGGCAHGCLIQLENDCAEKETGEQKTNNGNQRDQAALDRIFLFLLS
jgi:hypothetical protein